MLELRSLTLNIRAFSFIVRQRVKKSKNCPDRNINAQSVELPYFTSETRIRILLEGVDSNVLSANGDRGNDSESPLDDGVLEITVNIVES